MPADRFDPKTDHDIIFLRRAHFFPKVRRLLACAEPDLVEFFGKFFGKKIEDLLRLGSPGRIFDSSVNVLRVLAKNHHVHLFRMLHGRGDTFEILDRPQTDEKIEKLTERDVERANAAPNWGRERTFNAD